MSMDASSTQDRVSTIDLGINLAISKSNSIADIQKTLAAVLSSEIWTSKSVETIGDPERLLTGDISKKKAFETGANLFILLHHHARLSDTERDDGLLDRICRSAHFRLFISQFYELLPRVDLISLSFHMAGTTSVSYTHLTLPTNREV